MELEHFIPDESQQIILGLTAERTVVVTGVAGSGKSLTLLKKAKQVATFSDSFAIIVFSITLKQFFIDELNDICQGKHHVYSLKEWNLSAKPKYTYMFVDECQDFTAEEIDDLREHGTYCWFFGDSDQSIMKFLKPDVQAVELTASQLGIHTQDLCFNHRLTRENARIGEHIKPYTRLTTTCLRHGDKPRLIRVDDQLEYMATTIRNGRLSGVGILVYFNEQVRKITSYFSAKGIPVQYKVRDEMDIDFKSTAPVVLTWHAAKGLQFDNVFIPFCGIGDFRMLIDVECIDPMDDEEKRDVLYVAATRPLNNMYLIYTNPLSEVFPKPDTDVYIPSLGDGETLI